MIHIYIISYERKFPAYGSVSLSGGFVTPPTGGKDDRLHVYEHNIKILLPITASVYVYVKDGAVPHCRRLPFAVRLCPLQ
jgi:hypothetical protein